MLSQPALWTSVLVALSVVDPAFALPISSHSIRAAAAAGNFGSCTVPQIKFAVGLDNRKETSFAPVDQTSFNHGSAQNIDIITQFVCDTLTNSCGADQAAKDTCATATTAADAETPKTGAQADAFNAAFGTQTNFAAVAAIDDQGRPVAGAAAGAASGAAAASNATAATTSAAAAASTDAAQAGGCAAGAVASNATAAGAAGASNATAADAAAGNATAAAAGAAAAGDFGSCTVPQIKFAAGLDGRKETSFAPVDQTSFNHGSAQNIAIITQFVCDTLTNSCKADQTAKDTCATAQTAAAAATAKTGAQADAFNAAFGITTDFAAVTAIDDQGNAIAGTGSAAGAAGAADAGAAGAAASASGSGAVKASATAKATTAAAAASTAGSAAAATGANLQTFTGSLGATPPAVTASADGQFQVDGNASFKDQQNALVRSCDVQHNQCANAANASGNSGALTVAACGDQQTKCNAAASA